MTDQTRHRVLRQAGVLAFLVGAIVIAPLNEGRAHPLSLMTVKSKLITPFDKMLSLKHVVIIGPSPNNYSGADSRVAQFIFNECLSGRYFKKVASLDGMRGEKEGGSLYA
jgi:hypothetical protein